MDSLSQVEGTGHVELYHSNLLREHALGIPKGTSPFWPHCMCSKWDWDFDWDFPREARFPRARYFPRAWDAASEEELIRKYRGASVSNCDDSGPHSDDDHETHYCEKFLKGRYANNRALAEFRGGKVSRFGKVNAASARKNLGSWKVPATSAPRSPAEETTPAAELSSGERRRKGKGKSPDSALCKKQLWLGQPAGPESGRSRLCADSGKKQKHQTYLTKNDLPEESL